MPARNNDYTGGEPEQKSLASLIQQLESEYQKTSDQVTQLSEQLEAERLQNDTEWRQFFIDACLTNTITGEPIRSREDFLLWKKQVEAAKAGQVPQQPYQDHQENQTFLLVESRDGFLVRVPADRLDAWAKAQSESPRELTEREKLLTEQLLERLYGPMGRAPMEENDAAPASSDITEEPPSPPDSSVLPPQPDTQEESVRRKPAKRTRRKPEKVPLLLWLISFSLIAAIIVFSLVPAPGANPGVDTSPVSDVPNKAPTYTSDQPTDYVGSVNSGFIHKEDCRYAKNIKSGNRVYYNTLADALADGRQKCSLCFAKSNTANTNHSQSSDNSLRPISPLSPPQNGAILYENGEERVAPLTIETKGSGYYYIKLKDTSGSEVLRFFVHGGETTEITVPLGEYSLSYASGNTWYGTFFLFGSETLYTKAADLFEFYVDEDDDMVYGWTVELYQHINGNLDVIPISADEF